MQRLLLVLMLLVAGSAAAQEKYPSRPIDFIVTWGTGGGADAMARQIANLAQPALGVALPVSNVPGASGTMLFGVAGFFMRRWDLPIPPLVMGIILGPMAEGYFLTSMVANGNDLSVFVTRPVSAVVLVLAAAMLVWPVVKAARRR